MKKNLVLLFSLASIFAISLSACDKQEGKGEEVQPQFKVNIALNDVEGVFDTHTETQNNYLNDTYDSIDKYGKGSSENSKPNSLTLSWSISDSELDLTGLRLTLFEKGLELGSDTRVPVVTYLLDKDATSTTITNLKVGMDYSWSITAIAGEKEHSSRQSDFSTKDGVARFISIDGLSNVRDCGGWTGLDGKKIKQGLLYRGEEFNKQNNGRAGSSASDYHYDPSKASATDPYGQKISEAGIKTVANELKPRLMSEAMRHSTGKVELIILRLNVAV